MSSVGQPSWRHPILRLHDRHVERRVVAAQAGATELGLELDAGTIRSALAYILVYTLLASRFGLSEATRLTRSVGGFFSASPPL
ncbi:hypothetical protein ACQEVY_23230 [Streptomyces sp. CA-288835]|uniref:hypothetical protein n=1 Tax=Streptomyces sp. CA-288835 TaxID=3240069 RepID=UPI003D8D0732